MLAIVPSATVLGVDGRAVEVQVHVSAGLPSFTVVGLPDAACRESGGRVRAALESLGPGTWPQRRITVNLAPSGVRKAGSALDLAIAVGLLVAGGHLTDAAARDRAFLGELGLDGRIRRVPGVVPLVAAARAEEVVVPADCVEEATLVTHRRVRGAATLPELVGALAGDRAWPEPPSSPPLPGDVDLPDLADVRGQHRARTALEVAAAGGHHLLLSGPPGAGKTMLARRLPGLLPPLPRDVAIETTRIHSAAGERLPPGGLVRRPPLRAPHHGASLVSLVGGGHATMRPGEISLAHGGVLFLDELGEFPPTALEALRQPLEEGRIRVCRASAAVAFPARFLLVGAMNPCPCGDGRPDHCRCADAQRARYARRLSGPLLDRFDLRVEVQRPTVEELLGDARPGEPTATVAARVARARDTADGRGVTDNSELDAAALEQWAPLSPEALRLLESELERGELSARGLQRVRRVALTCADLAGDAPPLTAEHVALALELRATPAALRGSAA